MTSTSMDSALWAFGRGTGVAALTLFTLSLVLGVVARSGRPVPGMGRVGVSDLHRTAALTGASLVLVHVVTLYFDPFSQLRLVDVLLPFLAAYRPAWLGLGTLAFDLLLLVTLVSVYRGRVGPRLFRAVHWSTYALWPLALLHAWRTGSDGRTGWFHLLALACVAVVAGAVAWRLAPSFEGRGWTRHPRRPA